MSGITLGGDNALFTRRHGDIACAFQFVNDEPAMVLWPIRRANVAAYIICMSAAWQYDEPGYLAQQAKIACELWGFDHSHWFRIAKIINDGLGDLVKMPPDPASYQKKQHKAGPIGEISLSAGGNTVSASEIYLPEPGELTKYQ